MKEIRTRFAPSPTGFLHVGGVRTAIFAWLLARHFQGKMLLRIEDTDQERLVPGAIRAIIDDLHWLGIEIDEGPGRAELERVGALWDGAPDLAGDCGPYIQSLRLEKYRAAAEDLVARGFAYRCDCSPAKLELERKLQQARKEPPGYSGHCRDRNVSRDVPHVIRFRIPEKETITLDDAVKSRITWESLALRDTVILKTDGFPTYHLAVVVDDHDMRISHVLRGDEWIPSAPIHILLYRAFDWEPPIFAHLPSVLGPDGKKLSKRHGATFVSAFREAGYMPEALRNFLVLIGWSPGAGSEQEIFTPEEMIAQFSLEHVNTAGGIFAYEKLNWMNGLYIRKLSHEELYERVRPLLLETGLQVDDAALRLIIPHIQERMELLRDAIPLVEFLFRETLPEPSALFQKGVGPAEAKRILELASKNLEGISEFSVAEIENALRPIVKETGLSAGGVFAVIRLAVTGKKVTPPLFESIHALGSERALKRIRDTRMLLEQQQ